MTIADHEARTSVLSLDGTWGFHPGDTADSLPPAPAGLGTIQVPGLWEAQGHLHLSGFAWYVRELDLADVEGHWTLAFGAVMDEATVHVNGVEVGAHAGAYTPFTVDVTGVLRAGRNVIAVRVLDIPADAPEHPRGPHGKQGWKNDLFPSPPSLYLTYGGIWQPVTLTRHGAVTLQDAFVNGDPARPEAKIRIRNRGGRIAAVVECTIDGRVTRQEVMVPGHADTEVVLHPRLDGLGRWSPESPALHHARFVVLADGFACDETEVRFGVRTVTVDGDRILLNGAPRRVQAALVQGFRADTLYAEGSRDAIEREVRAAKAIGLNMLRLHIKAFDPRYLDVCDELGMLVHCDLPIAEPIAVDELDDTGPLARACAAAAAEQVLRDRNHPSVVLWSAMNEIGAENTDRDVRASAGYERFARMLYALVTDLDGTRPVIENDSVEPGPEHVYRSPILTAHWYGRLSRQYLAALRAKSAAAPVPGKVLLVSEFGDWGLPSLETSTTDTPFWWPVHLADDIAALPWPGTAAAFVEGTQAYQGLADRLQIELFRSTPGIAGWCLTELTDVPHEYNGLWDLERGGKDPAIREVAAACRPTLPIALHDDDAWNGFAGETFGLSVVVSNDTPTTVTGEWSVDGVTGTATLLPYTPTTPHPVTVPLPSRPGRHELSVTWKAPGAAPVEQRYPLTVLARPSAAHPVHLLGSATDERALATVGARTGDTGCLVVGEGALSAATGPLVDAALREGRNVLVLAQGVDGAAHLPVPATVKDLATEWGSLPNVFTTGEAVLSAVPPGTVVTTELLSVTAHVVYTSLDGRDWPQRPVLGVYKPLPGRLTGVIVAALPVHDGWLWLCQLPLVDAVLRDDPTAVATLADLIGAAS
ncbi:glycoside hydrolase family 2 TIM barrel-domain containing protein [Dactylosporangium sp. NPDC049525]|uniref:glycoside hydrolase family 2 protein n=1 Tax=Dactylosporangium sp. NPDC049525 TaxID=3154730 RepID=UPI00343DCD1F